MRASCCEAVGPYRCRVPVITLLCLLLCVWWTLCCGQTCHSTGPEGTCSISGSCREEHRREDEECRHLDQVMPTVLPSTVQECRRIGFFYYPACDSHSPAPPTNESYILDNPISAVNASFYSVNWRSFAINVTWEHRINPAEGYQLKFSRGLHNTIKCFCIYDPSLRNLEINITHVNYDQDNQFIIELSLIHSPDLTPSASLVTHAYEWPKTCLDIAHTDSTCALPIYGPPTNVTVYQEYDPLHNQTLYIEWSYQTEFILPTVYYIELHDYNDPYSDDNYHTFVTNNTNMVTISQLNNSVTFIIRIRPYLRCSGLANKTHSLGCGISLSDISLRMALPPPLSLPTTVPSLSPPISMTPIHPTSPSSLAPPVGPTPPANSIVIHLLLVSISTAGGVCILLVVIILMTLCARPRYRHVLKLELSTQQDLSTHPGLKEIKASGDQLHIIEP